MKKKKLKTYVVEYASNMFTDNPKQNCINSYEELKEGEYIVVEHKGYGVFIAKVMHLNYDSFDYDYPYRYLQRIDLSDYLDKIERQKRKEELEKEMEKRLENIDKKLKLKYYASVDSEFKKLFDEYEDLEKVD